jgi:hypothetical protein
MNVIPLFYSQTLLLVFLGLKPQVRFSEELPSVILGLLRLERDRTLVAGCFALISRWCGNFNINP